MPELPSDYYDQRLRGVLAPYETSPWRLIYDRAVSLLPPDPGVRTVDIGCGTGRCAEAIRRAGYERYTGFDFSAERIALAREYVPDFDFWQMDAFSAAAMSLYQEGQAFIITEVLEHLERDRELIAMLPRDALVILSVPNYLSKGHVRHFKDAGHVRERYGDLIAIDSLVEFHPNSSRPHKTVFVASGSKVAVGYPIHAA